MKEQVFTFGSHRGLVGIFTEPEDLDPHAPLVVVSNVGLNHRPGPNRIYVELARQLAAAGIRFFRFDLSGLGDSAPRKNQQAENERALTDVSEAIDMLDARFSPPGIIVMGLCSGVDSTHAAALKHPKVTGAIFVDGYAYPTDRSKKMRQQRIFEPTRWRRFLSTRFGKLRRDQPQNGERVGHIYSRDYPHQDRFQSDVKAMLAKNLKLFFVYTAWGDNSYSYDDQFFDFCPAARQSSVVVEYFPTGDHLFSYPVERQRFFASVERWLEKQFESPSEAPVTSEAQQNS